MCHLVIGLHIRDLLFYKLKIGNGLPLHLACIGVGDRSVTRRPDNARCTRSDRIAAILKRKHRDLKSLALLSEHVLFRNPDILERKVTSITRADPKFAM